MVELEAFLGEANLYPNLEVFRGDELVVETFKDIGSDVLIREVSEFVPVDTAEVAEINVHIESGSDFSDSGVYECRAASVRLSNSV